MLARRFPLLLMILAAPALVYAIVRELLQWDEPAHRLAAALYLIHLCWIVLESRITVSSSQQDERPTDRGTLQFYGTARAVTVIGATFGANDRHDLHLWMLATTLLFLGGITLRLVAIHSLGRFYSHSVRALGDHEVVQGGVYRWIRHPAYAGMILANTGFVLFFLNPLSVAALVVLLVPSIIVRILIEERLLFAIDGYPEYASGRRRLIPHVW
ncbi:guanylate kinase [Parafrankia colletiae]|uniref:Guanylate kinase n=1 Tax=Parafrankia colletiae TaxID=573497 RepID=A0A1S1QH59_9ACTN|nr:isoprenylcysteine carboxylmethyltransferase family protein [Parafrankia colletiae]MCK9902039.1 isoprenylcysteine carboxylmethyltransferase family protein [Frankia sp. Cpl3]OHV33300.1 guanylate kinase [Parafrankia colletiae]